MPGYDDFLVSFERQGLRTYAVHARTESGDQAAATFTVPFDDVELASALTTLGRAVEATTADSSQRRLTAREIGGRLAAALFDLVSANSSTRPCAGPTKASGVCAFGSRSGDPGAAGRAMGVSLSTSHLPG